MHYDQNLLAFNYETVTFRADAFAATIARADSAVVNNIAGQIVSSADMPLHMVDPITNTATARPVTQAYVVLDCTKSSVLFYLLQSGRMDGSQWLSVR